MSNFQPQKRSYDTLPDMLRDLKLMVENFYIQRSFENGDVDGNFFGNWNANISCGGDYHNFVFKTSNNIDLFETQTQCNFGQDDNQQYENLEALNTELDHIRDFLKDNEDSLGHTRMTYEILSNGGRSLLLVKCWGRRQPSAVLDQGQPKKTEVVKMQLQKYSDIYMTGLVTGLGMLPIAFIAVYLSNKINA